MRFAAIWAPPPVVQRVYMDYQVQDQPIYAGEQVSTRRFATPSQRGIKAQLTGVQRAIAAPGDRDGTCLSAAQKTAIAPIFSGATTSTGEPIYSSFPYDAGLSSGGIAFWEFFAPLVLDSGAVGLIFGVPPANPATFNGPMFALTGNIDDMFASISASNGTYTESAMSFMTPPNPTDMGALKNRGGKILVYHGVADPIFSVDDSEAWYKGLQAALPDATVTAPHTAASVPRTSVGNSSGGPALNIGRSGGMEASIWAAISGENRATAPVRR